MTVQMSDNVVHDNDAPSWRIVWNPLWPFGPSAKTKRIRELERQLADSEALCRSLLQSGGRVKLELNDCEQDLARARADYNDALKALVVVKANLETAEARVEHQKAELQAVYKGLLNVHEALEREQLTTRELGGRLIDALVTLRRDGFNPMAASIDAWNRSNPAPDPTPTEAKLDTDWLEIVEAAQDRGGGDPKLYGKLIADAQRWRAKGISYKEIVKRIYEGFET